MADDCGLVGFVGAEEPEVPLTDRRRVLEMRQYVRETHGDLMRAWSMTSHLLHCLIEMQAKCFDGTEAKEWKDTLRWASRACMKLSGMIDTSFEVGACHDCDDAAWDEWLTDQGFEIDDPDTAPTKPTNPQTEGPLQ